MKTLKVYGWAVIFTATILLAACASHEARVADTSMMSGPDATMMQPDERMDLERRENALAINQAWLDERQSQLDKREGVLELRENAVAINQAWLSEKELQLENKMFEAGRKENAVAIHRAWLDEREKQLGLQEEDLDRRENAVAISRAWLNERELQLDKYESSLGADILAGTESFDAEMGFGPDADVTQETEPGAYLLAIQSGRCYAKVFVPAVYQTVAVTKPIALPRGEAFKPVLYQTVSEQIKVSDERANWEEILCDNNLTKNVVGDVQRALAGAGFNPGPIDGIIGRQTMAAVNDFQKTQNLTVANYLTVETVKALGVDF